MEQKKPPYQTICLIRTKDGKTYRAELIRLNKYAGNLERWRREDDVPRKQRYIQPKDVESWEAIE